jgi:hypothetical protein
VPDAGGVHRGGADDGVRNMQGDQDVNDIPEMVPIDSTTGERADLSVLEDNDVAFDPTTQHLDLTKNEKRRTTALMLAIQAYRELIVREAAMYTAMVAGGKQLHPASVDGMVRAAVQFDAFISGQLDPGPLTEGEIERPATGEPVE